MFHQQSDQHNHIKWIALLSLTALFSNKEMENSRVGHQTKLKRQNMKSKWTVLLVVPVPGQTKTLYEVI